MGKDLLKSQEYLDYLESFLTDNRKRRFLEILANRTRHFTIVVEDVYQLHNTSAVMRSCEVFGIQDLHVIEQKFGKTIDKEIAMGAEKWVDIHQYSRPQECIDKLRKKGYQIVAASPHEDAYPLTDFDVTKPSAIFFGTEKLGLSSEILEQADTYIKIPMVGFTESLNISVSAAIIIQDITTRLRDSNISWQLSSKELLEKRIDWSGKTIKNLDFVTSRFLESFEN